MITLPHTWTSSRTTTVEPERLPTDWKQLELTQCHQGGRNNQGHTDSELDRPARQAGHDTGSQPGAQHRGRDHDAERQRLDFDDRDVNERLHHDGEGVSNVHGPGNELVGNHARELEDGSRGSKAADPQGVEKVGHKADRRLEPARARDPRPRILGRSRVARPALIRDPEKGVSHGESCFPGSSPVSVSERDTSGASVQ